MLEEAKEKMEKVKQNYFETNKKINEKINKLQQKKDNGDIAPNKYEEEVQGYESQRRAEIQSYKEQLNEVYKSAEDKLKDQVGFGEGDPAKTTGILNNIDTLSKTEREIIADKWKEQSNYIGLKALREKDLLSVGEFSDIDEQKEELKKAYEGKMSLLESNGNYSSSIERMRDLSKTL